MTAPVKLDTPWGSFHAVRDSEGRLYCPVCKRFAAYSAKDLVYHLAYHVFSGRRGRGDGHGFDG